MRVSGDVLWIFDTCAVSVDAHAFPEELFIGCVIFSPITGKPFPEIGALQKLQPRAAHIHAFQRIDEPEDLGTLRAEVLAHLFNESEYRRSDHDVIDHFRISGDARKVFRERGFGRWNRQRC